MKKLFKKYFIPHEHNNFKPHFLRTEKIKNILLFTVAVEVLFLIHVFAIFPNSRFLADVLSSALVQGTNGARAEVLIQPLETNPILEKAAQLKADDMAEKGYFAHTSPEGKTPWQWLNQVDYGFNYAGENLAVNFVDSNDVIQAWLRSDSHRKNMLNRNFTEIGIATARGSYKGRDAIFVVQFFGKPRVKTAVASAPIKSVSEVKEINQPKSEVRGAVFKDEMFIAVPSLDMEPKMESEAKPLKENSSVEESPSLAEQVIVSPRTTLNYIYLALAALIALALLLKIFVRIKIQHPRLILNGLVIILMVVSVLFLNEYLSLAEARIF